MVFANAFQAKWRVLRPYIYIFWMENRVVEDPPSQLNGKFHYFFLKPPLSNLVCTYSLTTLCTRRLQFKLLFWTKDQETKKCVEISKSHENFSGYNGLDRWRWVHTAESYLKWEGCRYITMLAKLVYSGPAVTAQLLDNYWSLEQPDWPIKMQNQCVVTRIFTIGEQETPSYRQFSGPSQIIYCICGVRQII